MSQSKRIIITNEDDDKKLDLLTAGTTETIPVSMVNASGDQVVPSFDSVSGYAISDTDEGTPSYYGYVSIAGAWYIMREETNAGVSTYRYSVGSSNYDFSTRTTLTYSLFNEVF
jgi:hypothetical protein